MNPIRDTAERLYNAHGREGAKAYIRRVWRIKDSPAPDQICEWIDYFADMAERA